MVSWELNSLSPTDWSIALRTALRASLSMWWESTHVLKINFQCSKLLFRNVQTLCPVKLHFVQTLKNLFRQEKKKIVSSAHPQFIL